MSQGLVTSQEEFAAVCDEVMRRGVVAEVDARTG